MIDDACPPVDESSRLSIYGLKPDQILDSSLVVETGRHMRISAKEAWTDNTLITLTPTTLDDVKRWIGVPDQLGAKRACSCILPTEIPSVTSTHDYRELSANSRHSMHQLAYEYVHGDSSRVAVYKPLLDYMLDRAFINGFFLRQDIDIHDNAVLELGADIKLLYARHIRIWPTGQLKIVGDSKIDCVSIKGNYKPPEVGKVQKQPHTLEMAEKNIEEVHRG